MPAPTLVAGAPCWIDLYSSGAHRAIASYRELVGWNAEPPQVELGGHFTFTRNGKHAAGCMRHDGEDGLPDTWGVHLMTDDVAAAAAAAPEAETRSGSGRWSARTASRRCSWEGPASAPGSQRGEGLRGHRRDRHPAWFELHTRAYEPTGAFYRDVFGRDAHVMSDTDELHYTTLGEGEGRLAGIMDDSPYPARSRPTGRSTSR